MEVLPASHSIGKAFRAYEPAIDLFPWIFGRALLRGSYDEAPRSLYGHGNAAGYQPLRRAIAEYVGASRGVHCSAEQIIVTSGIQQALDLIGRFLLARRRSGLDGRPWLLPARSKRSAPQVRVSFQYQWMETASS